MYSELTDRQNLEFFARLNSLQDFENTILEKTTLIGLSDRLDTKVSTLSHGSVKRTAIARALIHEPLLILFDEPESGLDRESLGLLEEIIGGELAKGTSILMTTHSKEIVYKGVIRNQRILKGVLVDDIA